MSTKKYRIRLTTDEQQELNALVSRGRAAAYKQTHARILLMSDESRSDGGMKDADITSALGVGQSTVERIRKRCVEEGVESALNRRKELRRRQKRRLPPHITSPRCSRRPLSPSLAVSDVPGASLIIYANGAVCQEGQKTNSRAILL